MRWARRRPAAVVAIVLLLTLGVSRIPVGAPVAGAASATPPPVAQVLVTEVRYPVVGTTIAELVAAMRAYEVRDGSGAHVFGLTAWRADWTYAYSRPAWCRTSDPRVAVRVTVTLPDWDPPAGASATSRARWAAFRTALVLHERAHVANIERAAHEVMAMLRVIEAPTCAALEVATDEAGERILARARAWDRAYDRLTGHGATQGAVLGR